MHKLHHQILTDHSQLVPDDMYAAADFAVDYLAQETSSSPVSSAMEVHQAVLHVRV